jgi:hypothetical protein
VLCSAVAPPHPRCGAAEPSLRGRAATLCCRCTSAVYTAAGPWEGPPRAVTAALCWLGVLAGPGRQPAVRCSQQDTSQKGMLARASIPSAAGFSRPASPYDRGRRTTVPVEPRLPGGQCPIIIPCVDGVSAACCPLLLFCAPRLCITARPTTASFLVEVAPVLDARRRPGTGCQTGRSPCKPQCTCKAAVV